MIPARASKYQGDRGGETEVVDPDRSRRIQPNRPARSRTVAIQRSTNGTVCTACCRSQAAAPLIGAMG
jgi:hypothetical protein